RSPAVAIPPKRRGLAERRYLRSHRGALPLEEILHRAGEAGVADPVRAPGLHRQIAALDLVLALRPGLHALEAMGDGIVDRLVVAGLEMQEAEVAEAAPVAAIECRAAAQIERAGHRPAVLLRHHQHDLVGHAGANRLEEAAGQVGSAPFAVAGIHVESKEGVPVPWLDLAAA